MDSEIKKEWVAALRSGNYKQCRNVFRPSPDSLTAEKYGNDSYCCLAVLADVYSKKTGKGKWEKNLLVDENDELVNGAQFYLWAGLSVADTTQCINLNDKQKYNFEQIATYIEENL